MTTSGGAPDAPINGAELLSALTTLFRRFLALPPHAPDAMALWVLHTWTIDAALITPRLAFKSPDQRCGKSTVLHLLEAVVRAPVSSANISAAAAYRLVDSTQPTLVIDEADSFLKKAGDLRNILNSGHCRQGAVVHRAAADGGTQAFSTFAAVVIAGIGEFLLATVRDRSIEIKMHRALPGEVVERLRLDHLHRECAPLRQRCAQWARENLAALAEADPEMPDGLDDRAADNWRILVAIADRAGGDWPVWAGEAAQVLSGSGTGEATVRCQLLADIRGLFATKGETRLASTAISQALAGLEERPWTEWRNGRPITPTQLAQELKQFDISSRDIKFGRGPGARVAKGYLLDDFADAFARYLPPPAGDGNAAATPLICNEKIAKSRSNPPAPVAAGDRKYVDENNVVAAVAALAGRAACAVRGAPRPWRPGSVWAGRAMLTLVPTDVLARGATQ